MTTDFLTLHIALATYPKGKSRKYVESIEEYYSKFKNNTRNYYSNAEELKSSHLDGLYQPLTYHIFGSFDVAFITLIDNYKFTQKIFFPEDNDYESVGGGIETNSYQVLTGIFPNNDSGDIRKQLQVFGRKRFVSITNLKLSNGFLVGNGYDFVDFAIQAVSDKLRDHKVDFVFLQSFSWFEITVVIFLDDITQIGDIVGEIRDIALQDLPKEKADQLITNSFYHSFWKSKSELLTFHLFADSQSYLGVKFSEYVAEDRYNVFKKFKLNTHVEWQVKPGQLSNLVQSLREIDVSKTKSKPQPIFALSGKSDYWITEADGTLADNYKLFQESMNATSHAFMEQVPNFRKHIRNYKTRLLVNFNVEKKDPLPPLSGNFKNPIGEKLYFKSADIRITYAQLKSLKISRHIRQKINKIFFNYNTGIQDPVLSIFFYDFYNFLHFLRLVINDEYRMFREVFIDGVYDPYKPLKTVDKIEQILEEFIQTFEEGYHIRTLNCYQFEEIYDFDLDLNSSIQQLLTTYNTIVLDIAAGLRKQDSYAVRYAQEEPQREIFFGHQQLVQLNLRYTVSTSIGINYNVYHLTTPEFIFFTLGKEILNSVAKIGEHPGALQTLEWDTIPELIKELTSYLTSSQDPCIIGLREEDLLIPQSYLIDFLQLGFICNGDLKLYEYWFWMYNFQNTSLYTTKGMFNEYHFRRELFRLFFLAKLTDKESGIDQLTCPIEEVSTYWHRYYSDTKRGVEKFFKDNEGFCQMLPFFLDGWFLSALAGSKFSATFYEQEFLKDPTQLFRKEQQEDKISFLRKIMNSYLKWIFEKNKGTVAVLRRDWESGRPLEKFIQSTKNDDRLFLVDPLGGLFFTDMTREKEYYCVQNGVLNSLWNYAMISKCDFLKSTCETSQPA